MSSRATLMPFLAGTVVAGVVVGGATWMRRTAASWADFLDDSMDVWDD